MLLNTRRRTSTMQHYVNGEIKEGGKSVCPALIFRNKKKTKTKSKNISIQYFTREAFHSFFFVFFLTKRSNYFGTLCAYYERLFSMESWESLSKKPLMQVESSSAAWRSSNFVNVIAIRSITRHQSKIRNSFSLSLYSFYVSRQGQQGI